MRKLKRLIGSFLAAGMILSGIPVLPASAAEGGTDAAQLEGTGEILYDRIFPLLRNLTCLPEITLAHGAPLRIR